MKPKKLLLSILLLPVQVVQSIDVVHPHLRREILQQATISTSTASATQESTQTTTSAASTNNLYVAYKYSWLGEGGYSANSDGIDCEAPTPSPIISCSGGQAERLDGFGCAVSSSNSQNIVCDPKREGSLTFRCIGSNPEELQAVATLPAASTLCAGMCIDTILTTCGWAKQTATLEILCDVNKRQTGSEDDACYSETSTTLPCRTNIKEVKLTSAGHLEETCIKELDICGDGVCGPEEDSGSCPHDCIPRCGDSICNPGEEQDCFEDCRGKMLSGDKTTDHVFAWNAIHNVKDYECDEPGPAPQIKCGGNGSIEIVKHTEENHNCSYKTDDLSTVLCEPQPDIGLLVVRCYGFETNDLKLTATLPKISAKCNGSGGFPYLYASGYLKQVGLLGTSCGTGDDQKFMEMKKDDCNADFDDVNLHCSTSKYCQAPGIMDFYCYVTLDEVVMTTTRDLVGDNCIYSRK